VVPLLILPDFGRVREMPSRYRAEHRAHRSLELFAREVMPAFR